MVQSTYCEEGGYLKVIVKGVVSEINMLQAIETIAKDSSLPKDLKIVEDATEAITSFGLNEINKIMEDLEIVIKKFESVKHAVILSSPESTALAFIVENRIINKFYKFKVFSSESAAISWINS